MNLIICGGPSCPKHDRTSTRRKHWQSQWHSIKTRFVSATRRCQGLGGVPSWLGAARKHSASLRRDKPGSGHPVRDGGAGPVPSLTLRATMAAEEQGSGPVPTLTLRATMAAEGQGPGPVLADASGYDGSGRTRGRTGSITDASGYEIICALFTFLRARRLQRSSFLRPGRLDRGAERGSCIKTGPREKRPGPQKARARRSCAGKCRSRRAGAGKTMRQGNHSLLFVSARLGSAPNCVASEETDGRFSARLPSSTVTLARRAVRLYPLLTTGLRR